MPLTRLVIDYKDSVKAATTGAVTLTGGAPNTVDGVSLALNDRVLVKNQANAAQNGIYRVSVVGSGSNGTWVRANDFDDWRKITPGSMVFIDSGTTNGNVFYFIRGGLGNVVIDSTAINFSNLSATFASGILLGGANSQVQFNDAGNFGGIASFNVNKTTGAVGIGTTSPGKTLDVVGQSRISGSAASGYALMEYGTSATVTNNWHVGSEGDGTFRWYNGNFGSGTEYMRITSSGQVGIGTTSPGTRLHVLRNDFQTGYSEIAAFVQQVNAGNTSILSFGQVADNQSFIEARDESNNKGFLLLQPYGGSVGIGGSPTVKLDVQGTGAVYSRVASTNSNFAILQLASGANIAQMETSGATTYLTNYVSGGTLQISQAGAGSIRLYTNGTENLTILSTGNVGIGNSAPMADLQTGPGSATIAPFMIPGGTNLTVAQPGAVEHDGVNFYSTNNTTNGRGAIPTEHRYTLQGTGAAVSTTANFFGTNSNIPLVANGIYDIDIYLHFLKTTASTCNIRLTNTANPTNMDVEWEQTAVTGVANPPGTATLLSGRHYANTAANWWVTTGSLSTGANHTIKLKVLLINGSGTSLKIEANATAGTMTPLVASRWVARRIQANVGATAA